MASPEQPSRHRSASPAASPGRGPVRSRSRTLNVPPQVDGPASQPESTRAPSSTASATHYGTGSSVSPASREPGSPVSPGTSARVFPVKSVVSVDPTPTTNRITNNVEKLAQTSFDMSRSSSWQSEPRRRLSLSASSIHAGQPNGASLRARERISLDGAGSRSRIVDLGGQTEESIARSGYLNHLLRQSRGHGDTTTTDSANSTNQDVAPEASSRASDPLRNVGRDPATGEDLMTARFTHVLTAEGHAIITGRDGDTPQRCEDEPIHLPGAIQGFGVLIALREETEGRFVVRVVSENVEAILGYTPRDLFRLDSFGDILSAEQRENLLDQIDFIRDGESDPAVNGPEVFMLSLRPSGRRTIKLWCAMHINDTNPDLILCEFELDDDRINPPVPAQDVMENPEDTLRGDPTAEEFEESTAAVSKPLRVLRRARKRHGEAAAMEVFNIMSQVQEQLGAANSLERFLKVLVGVVRELTGFHRVMIYQFDQQWNGRVVAELVDPRATRDLYKGLNFPASDIPKQARDLYKINRVRLLYDRDQPTARLVCRTTDDLETPLDMTYSYLRAMSPIHLKYLANMAVRASMSISINTFDELWGLIACHAYGPKGMRVSFPIRKMCRLVGDSASRNIERLSYASRLQARKLINTVPTEHNPSGYIVASGDDLLTLFDADFGLLAIRDETKIMGKLEQTQEALAMLEYIRLRRITSVLSSQDIREDFPDLRYAPGFQVIAGLLLVPLSVSGEDFIVFFRRSQLKYVRWAGNPYEKVFKEGTESYLEPRKSFKVWTETVVGKCREWTEEQIETAAVLCLVYGKFIAVWRQKEAALQRSQLTRLLLANSAHEVRTPLNAVINYLEIALEGNLDSDTREYLSKSHSASKSLICVINDLLDLTKAEEGQALIKDEVFDLLATVKEAADMFSGDAARKQIGLDVVEGAGLPRWVVGDQRRVRQAVSNVITNAIQHTSNGRVCIELSVAQRQDGRVEVDIIIEDTGEGMSTDELDAIFREMEQVQTYEDDLAPGATPTSVVQLPAGESERKKRALGLGLATVARIVRNMEGQLRLKSEQGKGSRFVIQLPFDLPADDKEPGILLPIPQTQVQVQTAMPPVPGGPTTPPPVEGERMLIDHVSPVRKFSRPGSVRRQGSAESRNSLRSFQSQDSGRSARSDVDQLIGMIQEPYKVSTMAESAARKLSQPESEHHPSRVSSEQVMAGRRPSSSHQMNAVSTTRIGGRSPARSFPGSAPIQDSLTPLRAVRVGGDDFESPSSARRRSLEARSQSPIKLRTAPAPAAMPTLEPPVPTDPKSLNVLVAEDDPINSKIVKKRLEKNGHIVTLTVNGEECASVYHRDPAKFDVVLMDMQMPIVDGLTSTKMIRSFERAHPAGSNQTQRTTEVPIFAVSASLVEKGLKEYIEAGFDGWVLKPINFESLQQFFVGIVDPEARARAAYVPGKWERGGWFKARGGPPFRRNDHHLHQQDQHHQQQQQDRQDRQHGQSRRPHPPSEPVSPLSSTDISSRKMEMDALTKAIARAATG
ncbi:MAG: hypothetical protein M1823_002099 [Watsoniomyces obsoletus]|nr:MAG: hypothetical protein M1823_002099 [Watsoniomyces obsoletus]